jgi:hypothetical protein
MSQEGSHRSDFRGFPAALQQLHRGQRRNRALRIWNALDKPARAILTSEIPDQYVSVEDYVSYRAALTRLSHLSTLCMSRRPFQIPNPVASNSGWGVLSKGARTAMCRPRYVMAIWRPRRTSASNAAVFWRNSFAVALFTALCSCQVYTAKCTLRKGLMGGRHPAG